MNELIKKIIIKTDSSDIDITEGDNLSIIGGNFSIQDGTLNITPKDDITMVIPAGEYESFEIVTDSGSLNVDLKNCHIHKFVFSSDSGDADVSADIDHINLSSDSGVCSFYKTKVTHTLNTRTINKTLTTSIHKVKNERYD